jgi:predicted phage terminase large subunit-like protein
MSSSVADPQQLDPAVVAAASPAALAHVVTQGRWVPFEHLLKIDEALLKVASREITRLLIEVPIRHGKSELVSRYTPAWWLGRFPDDQVMLAAYEAEFARSWGRKARDVLAEFGPTVFGVDVADMPASADWWHVEDHEGVMVTAGVGGALTGKGADLLIIDDPVKNAEQANSEVYRQKTWDWWQSTARSRLQPGGRVVVVMARWHEDDLAGRLIANQDEKEPWTLLQLPALAEDDDPMGRKPGEALCPEMFTEKDLARTKQELGSYWFSALLQQKPAPAEGLMFKRSHFRYWQQDDGVTWSLETDEGLRHVDSGMLTRFQTVDVAISDRETADWTVVSTWAVSDRKELILIDLERQHFEEQQTIAFLKRCSDRHGRPRMYVERFGAGRSPLAVLSREGYPVSEIPAEAGTQQNKTTRAFVAVAAYERHSVFHPSPRPEWLDAFEDELTSFPLAKNDDQVDTVSYAARLLPTLAVDEVVREPSYRPLSAGIMTARF